MRHGHIRGGTFAQVIGAYLASAKFAELARSTQDGYRRILAVAQLPDVLGSKSVEEMRPRLVQDFLDCFSDRPGQMRCALTALKAVERYALVRDMLPGTISLGCQCTGEIGGHVPWTEEQVRLAEAKCRPELARVVTLGANTGQRGSDLVRMAWSDIEIYDGRQGINVTQQKTGIKLWIPFTQELERAIATWERRPTPILLAPDGTPWTRNRLSVAWLRERAREDLADLAECTLHALRGTACVRLLRAGAHTRQIVDLVGMSEQMVKRYTRFASQRENALAAVAHLDERRTNVTGKDGKFSRG